MRPLRWLFGIATGALSFGYLIFVLQPIQILSIALYPVSRTAFREVNRWCARSIWGLWVLIAEVQHGIRLRFTGDPIPFRENALLLPNHQSMADLMVVMCFAWRCGRLADLKWFAKNAIKYFPGFGWGMLFIDCIFVKRDWTRDRANIDRLFGKYKTNQIPVFLVSFLEGTRLKPEKLQRSQQFARERGLDVPRNNMVPRTKGFVTTVHGLRDHLDAVYSITIGYPERTPTLVDCFAGDIDNIEVNVRRYPILGLPSDDDALTQWAFDRFREQDDLLDAFVTEHRFAGTELPGRVRLLDWFFPERRHRARSDAGPVRSAPTPNEAGSRSPTQEK